MIFLFGIMSKRTKQNSESDSKTPKQPKSDRKGHSESDSEKPSRKALEASVMFKGIGHAGEVSRLYGLSGGETTLQMFDEIKEVTERIKSGDLSDVERILTEQLCLMHAATHHSMSWYSSTKMMPHRKLALQAVTQTSRATRQIAVAISNIKNPRRFTVIEKQQNVMVNGADAQGSKQLGESTNAPMDTGSQKTSETVDARAEALVEVDRAKDSRRKGAG